MKVIALTTYFAAAVSFALAAEMLRIPNWINVVNPNVAASIPSQNLESRSTCEIQQFTTCLMTFFGNIGLSSTALPSKNDFEYKFYQLLFQNPPEGMKELCSYLTALSKCAPSSDCWTLDSMNQLGFPNETNEAFDMLFNLVPFQYMCTNGYQTAINNWKCIVNSQDGNDNCSTEGKTCAYAEADLTCMESMWTKKCNNDVGKMMCLAIGAAFKGALPMCNANDLDNVCDGGGSTAGGSTTGSSTKASDTTTPNTGSQNDRFYLFFLALFNAFAVTYL
uniref:Secreted protein n=1 Tax=Plectus sambesii TaxID=2011161 RepID=A0A914WG39_9BILA